MFVYRAIRDASFKKWSSTGPRQTLRVKFIKTMPKFFKLSLHFISLCERTFIVPYCRINFVFEFSAIASVAGLSTHGVVIRSGNTF